MGARGDHNRARTEIRRSYEHVISPRQRPPPLSAVCPSAVPRSAVAATARPIGRMFNLPFMCSHHPHSVFRFEGSTTTSRPYFQICRFSSKRWEIAWVTTAQCFTGPNRPQADPITSTRVPPDQNRVPPSITEYHLVGPVASNLSSV
jgi:hypothetical protein